MRNILRTTGEVFIWTCFFIRHDDGVVAISKDIFFKGDASWISGVNCLQLILTLPHVKMIDSG